MLYVLLHACACKPCVMTKYDKCSKTYLVLLKQIYLIPIHQLYHHWQVTFVRCPQQCCHPLLTEQIPPNFLMNECTVQWLGKPGMGVEHRDASTHTHSHFTSSWSSTVPAPPSNSILTIESWPLLAASMTGLTGTTCKYNKEVQQDFIEAWVVRSKAATVRYFWIMHSCLI